MILGIKPATVEEMKSTVEEVLAMVSEESFLKASRNVRKRAHACLIAGGSHFERELKIKNRRERYERENEE